MKKHKKIEPSSFQPLYKNSFPSKRTGALYNAFSYSTKISPEAIGLFIATHTNPNDRILDTFAGSGTTGLGAILAERPTKEMLKTAEDLGVKAKWGPREVELYEIGVIGSFISEVLTNPPCPKEFKSAFEDLLSKASDLESSYKVDDLEGNEGTLRHAIWSDTLICSECAKETLYWDAAVTKNPVKLAKQYFCTSCKTEQVIEKLKRVEIEKYDNILKKSTTQRKRTPVWIYGKTGNSKWQRKATKNDFKALQEFDKCKYPKSSPIKELELGDLYRSGYHTGITHLHHLYTNRNFFVMSKLWELASGYECKSIRKALKFLILSYNSAHSTLMTRVVVKQSESDFVLTGAQTGVLYISSLPVEKNIIEGIRRKFSTIIKAFEITYGAKTKVTVKNQSSTKLQLKNMSIDYVFTDPPFGDYIPYSEINQINELWLGEVTVKKNEVIVSKSQNKTVATYKSLMTDVFKEIGRVLNEKGKATVVFHSAKLDIWEALMSAYTTAGLSVMESSILDKVQSSFKQTVSSISVKGDPLILLSKCISDKPQIEIEPLDAENFISKLIEPKNSKQDAQSAFSSYVSFCLKRGGLPQMGASRFYLLFSDISKKEVVVE